MIIVINTFFLVLVILITSLIQPAHAELFRCTGSEGKLSFQDYPCGSGSKQQTIDVPTSGNNISSNIVSVNNLIKNHGFDNGLTDWVIADIKSNQQGIYHRNKINGYQSAVLELSTITPPNDKYIYETRVEQCVYLERGKTFTLSAKVRLDKVISKSSANRLNIIWYETRDCSTGGQFGNYLEPKKQTGWQHIESRNLKPSLSARAAKIEIVQNGRFSQGVSAYWDNISLEIKERSSLLTKNIVAGKTLATGKNYIKNPSFDNNLSAWDKGGWSNQRVNDYQNKGSFKVSANSTTGPIGRGAFSQCINFGRNQRFAMGIGFKRDKNSTQDGGGRLRTAWYSEADCIGKGKIKYSVDPKPVDGWQKLTVSGMRAPEGSVSVKFTVIQSVAGVGEFSAYWDDAYFWRSY